MNIKKLVGNLKSIEQNLNTDTPENLVIMLDEIINEFTTNEINYYIAVSNKSYTEHVITYGKIARKFKNMALVDLQEIRYLLMKNNIQSESNRKRLQELLNKLIVRNFYAKDVKQRIAKWKPKTVGKLTKQEIGV